VLLFYLKSVVRVQMEARLMLLEKEDEQIKAQLQKENEELKALLKKQLSATETGQ
jgi:16S rRNA U1498 N3-methylase RsmE